MNLKTTVGRIKNLQTQGAENIALEAVEAIRRVLEKSKSKEKLLNARDVLLKSRPTEPCMANSLKYIFLNFGSRDFLELRRELNQKIFYVQKHFRESREKIVEIGSKKIKNSHIVFTHCHSSTVMSTLIQAKKQKNFEVHVTETRPMFQGRISASELSKAKIKTRVYIDSAARLALKNADMMLIGCDAISSEGQVINKIGSELFAEAADRIGVPVYVCTNSWKYDPETLFGFDTVIEERKKSEVWKNPPKNVQIDSHAFERIEPKLITGIISELGIYGPRAFVQETKAAYPWIQSSL